MDKNKKVLAGIAAVAILIIVGAIGGGYLLTDEGRKVFPADGYILEVSSEEDNRRVTGLAFSAGTRYKEKFPSSYVFQDVQGAKNTVGEKNFIHYNDGSLSAFSEGVAVNVQEIGDGFLEFYGLGQGMVMMKTEDGWEIDNNGNTMPFPEMIWQLSENKLLAASDEMTLELTGREPEKLSGYLEVTWVDKGIVQIADKDNVWQILAKDGRLTYKNGAALDFARGVVTGADGRVGFTLEELYADAENSIAIRSKSAVSWEPPSYHFETQNGKDGETGRVGETGKIGETGEAGEAGETGENGVNGENGTDAVAGSSGAAGADGRKGEGGRKGGGDEQQAEEEPGLGSIKLADLKYDTSSITKLTLTVEDINYSLTQNSREGTIELRDAKTKALVARTAFMIDDSVNDDIITCDVDVKDFQNVLRPDKEYTLSVIKDYVISGESNGGDAKEGIKTFIKRDFFTDSNGVTVDVEKVEEDGVYLWFTNLLAGVGEGKLPTGYMLRILSGEKWATYPESSSGGSVTAGTLSYDKELHIPIAELFGRTLGTSNIPYTIELYVGDRGLWALDENDIPRGVSDGSVIKSSHVLSGITLKKQPKIGNVSAAQGENCFDLSVSVLSDPDRSIKNYRFTVIQDERIIKILDVDNNYAKWYYDESENNGLPCEIACEVTYLDNEKENVVKAESAYPVYIRDTGLDSKINYHRYIQDAQGNWRSPARPGKTITDVDEGSSVAGQVRIWGDIVLQLNSGSKLMKDRELRIVIKKVSTSNTSAPDSSKVFLWYIPYEEQGNQTIIIPVKWLEVEAGADYSISVYGQATVSSDGEVREICLGTTEIRNLQ